jgi:hypothetical protein
MRLLITCLMGLSLSIAGLPGLLSIGSAAAAVAAAPSSPRPTVQARGKKRRPRTQKVKKTDKKTDNKKKNDPGFAL